MTLDYASDGCSSPLSSAPPTEFSLSPSPPPEYEALEARYNRKRGYPSPSLSNSQRSSARTSPAPKDMAPTPPADDNDCTPPAKKRKTAGPKARTTERLDLRSGEVCDQERPQLDRLLKALHKKRKIVVVAGAGISVSAGIPDFRSSNGLFNTLRKDQKLKSSGKDLFDASVYQDDKATSSFHNMVRSLSQKTKDAKPTEFHHLLATLAQEDRLLRLYSQNVDGIDTALPPLQTQVPLPKKGPWPKTVQLHGGLDYMVCSKCHKVSDFDADKFDGPVPPACSTCEETDSVRQAADRRSHGIGRLRPRMVLYNEHNPDDEAIGSCVAQDMRTRPDAIIVVGTTLKIPGVKRIVREICGIVRDRRDGLAVWINNDPEPIGKEFANCWDLIVRGPCDEVARHAALGRWDGGDWRETTTEMRDKLTPDDYKKVVVSTPKKPKGVQQVQQLATPVASPRIAPQQPVNEASLKEAPTPTKSNSKKRKVDAFQFINSAVGKKGAEPQPKKRKPQPKKTATTKAPAKAKGKTKTKNNAKITQNFGVKKQRVGTQASKDLKAKKMSSEDNSTEQLPTLPTANAMTEKGGPIGWLQDKVVKITKWKPLQYHRPSLSQVSPGEARNNSSPCLFPLRRPSPEPFTSPPASPEKHSYPDYPIPTTPQQDSDERPSSSSSRYSQTITPTGALPHGMSELLS